ncbi:somatostatin receptor type 4-like [Ostrea edulis]|uniref:somatostatin receptor type 4-like n=1 Tax=Ostrea edulis TaxID=37623 RepID=UPI0024AFA89A|nr:somatostatin receptor type 4-like [Ostrea edulis]
MNTTVAYENALQKDFEPSRHYLNDNRSNTIGYFNVFSNFTINTSTSGNGTRAVGGKFDNIPFLLFTLDNFQSEYSKTIAVIILVIGSLGLVGNLCTILKIWNDKKFHTPTFAVIGCLALADFLSIVRTYATKFTTLRHFGKGAQSLIGFFIAYEMTFFSSIGHMVLLSVVRYLIIVHPLQSRSHLTTLVVILWSVTVWILSLILSLFGALYIDILISSQIENMVQIYNWSLNLLYLIQALFTFCTIIILHCLKLKSLQSSRVRTKTTKKMNLIIALILGVFLTFQFFITVLGVIRLLSSYRIFSSHVPILEIARHLEDVAILLQIIHFSCNPYIYFLISCCVRTK